MNPTIRPLLTQLDEIAEAIAQRPLTGNEYTESVLNTTARLYRSAKSEISFADEYFESAYHSPITGDLEFFLARVLYWYSKHNSHGWKIYLRRQMQKVAPDLRVEVGGKTIAVIEVKAKAGFQQCCYSPERFDYDLERFNSKKCSTDPRELVNRLRGQISKYIAAFDLKPEGIFLLMPSLVTVHRVKYKSTLDDYYQYISNTTTLPKENLIILSDSLRLNLSNAAPGKLMPNGNFERMIQTIASASSLAVE